MASTIGLISQDGLYTRARDAQVPRHNRRVSPPSLAALTQLTHIRIGRGTAYHSGIAIAYATLHYILRHIGCRTLFATHYHELCDILQAEASANTDPRVSEVEYWHTDLDESVSISSSRRNFADRPQAGRFSYSYRLKRGVNRESHAIVCLIVKPVPKPETDIRPW